MRTGATQQSPVSNPHIKITIGADVYNSEGAGGDERIVSAYEDEMVFGGVYHFLLDNADGALNTKDYKGRGVVVNHGFIGVVGSNIGDLWVENQEFISKEGKLLLHLTCIDAWGLLSRVKGTVGGAYWNFPWQDPTELAELSLDSGEPLPATLIAAITAHYDKTVKQIITTTISDALNMTVDEDDTDAYINVQKPQVAAKDARSIVVQALGVTESYLLWKADGKFHIVEPSAHASVYNYNVSNLFFNNTDEQELTIPNRIIYWFINKVDPADSSTWVWTSGQAVDATSYSRLGIYIDEHHNLEQEAWESVTSQADANARAAARLAHLQLGLATGTLVAPMHCSQELFDKVIILDDRYSPTKSITGYVFRIIREYDRGVYRITLQLGGVETGYTPSGGEEVGVSPSSITHPLSPPSTWQIPKAIQGYQHDIHFIADDQDTVSWGAGTIKFYDETTQSINAGNYTMPDGVVRYLYFDLDDASPAVLKATDNYLSVMTLKTGVLCLVQKGSTAEIDATVIPSYGKEPLITPDVIQMNGLLAYNYGAGKKLQVLLETQVSAGLLKLTAATLKDGEWYDENGVVISALRGVGIYGGQVAFETYPTKANYDAQVNRQCYIGTDGKIYGGGGAAYLDSQGFNVKGQYFILRDAWGNIRGYLYGGTNLTLASSGGHILLNPAGYDIYLYGDVLPSNVAYTCGATGNWFRGVYTEYIYSRGTGHAELSAMQWMNCPRRAGDPTGVVGRFYYNTVTGFYRVYQAGAWQSLAIV